MSEEKDGEKQIHQGTFAVFQGGVCNQAVGWVHRNKVPPLIEYWVMAKGHPPLGWEYPDSLNTFGNPSLPWNFVHIGPEITPMPATKQAFLAHLQGLNPASTYDPARRLLDDPALARHDVN
jgi:hypothetical protein